MRKKMVILAAALSLALLTGCSGSSGSEEAQAIPEGMTEATVMAAGEELVDLLLAQDYDGVYAAFRADVQESMTAADLSAFVSPTLEKAGGVKELSGALAFGEDEPEVHAIARFLYDCEKRDLELSLAFDPQMELIGIETELQRGSFKFSNIGKNFMNLFSK